ENDANNCGACGNVCPSGFCEDGSCPACQSGTFSEVTKSGGNETVGSYFEDLDGDGFLDTIWINQLDQTATVWWGDGTNYFGPDSTTFSVGRSGGGAGFGDVNGDGRKDVVASNQDSSQVRVALQTAPRTFPGLTSISQSGFPTWIVLFDANRDGKLDMLVKASSMGCWVLRQGDGTGGFAAGACLSGVPITNGIVRAADLDNDGWAELVWRDPSVVQMVVAKMTASGAVQGTTPVPVPGHTTLGLPDLLDLNQDGLIDIVASAESGGTYSVLVLYGVGGLAYSPCKFGPTPGNVSPLSFGDPNKDKKPEYVRSTTCAYCSSTYYIGRAQ
ncbi:MAG TPA: FG-GAP-like repeat-containing protein, partial [Polyangiaceae bacterium]|nr:FG-GAP-like repeat-containing protein [Polyangiaceae bacterium]